MHPGNPSCKASWRRTSCPSRCVNVEHPPDPPVGARVKAEARFWRNEGKSYAFNVQVSDQVGEIGRGTTTAPQSRLRDCLQAFNAVGLPPWIPGPDASGPPSGAGDPGPSGKS